MIVKLHRQYVVILDQEIRFWAQAWLKPHKTLATQAGAKIFERYPNCSFMILNVVLSQDIVVANIAANKED